MAETDAFCWVNGVGMPHEWRQRIGQPFGSMICQRCMEKRFFSFSDPVENAQEGQDAHKTVSPPENEGQNA